MDYIAPPIFGVILTAGLLYFLSKKKKKIWVLWGFFIFYGTTFAFVGDLTGIGNFFINALAFLVSLPLFYVPYALYGLYSKYDSFLYTLIFPTSVVMMEFVATPLRLSPLMNIAYRFFYCTPIIQCASLIGAAGLSFIITWFIASTVTMITRKFATRYIVATVLSATLLLVAIIYGAVRLNNTTESSKYIKAAWATGPEMFMEDGEWQFLPYEQYLDTFMETSGEAAERGAELLIYSEEAFTIEADMREEFLDVVSDRAKELGLAMLVGVDAEVDEGRQNVIYYYDENGEQKGYYVKRMVIPIVETGYNRGDGEILQCEETFECGVTKVAAAICYDGNFGLYARRMDDDAEVYLYPSWDWSAIENMHTMIAGYRAVENGVTLVKSTTHGRSVMYDKYGRILFETHTDDGFGKVYNVDIPCDNTETFYERNGLIIDVVFVVCAVILITLASIGVIIAGNKRENESEKKE